MCITSKIVGWLATRRECELHLHLPVHTNIPSRKRKIEHTNTLFALFFLAFRCVLIRICLPLYNTALKSMLLHNSRLARWLKASSLLALATSFHIFHRREQILNHSRLRRAHFRLKLRHLLIVLRFQPRIRLRLVPGLLRHHARVPRLPLRPVRRDLPLRLLHRSAQPRRFLCVSPRIARAQSSVTATRSPRRPSPRRFDRPRVRTFARRAHDRLRLFLREHELRDPISRRVHPRDDRAPRRVANSRARATSVSLSRTTATRTKDDRSTKTLARGRHTARTMFASSTTSLARPTNSFVTGNNDGLKRTMMRGAAAVKRAPLVVESTCRDATTRGWGRATRARMRASRARVRARGVVNVAETRAAKYLARVRGGADDDDGRARARDWVIGMAD